MQIRRCVLLPLPSRRSFLEHYFEQNGSTGVWVFNDTSQPVGVEVDLEIAFAEEQMVFHARGIVRSKRLSGRRTLPAGMAIEFLPSELKTRQIVLDFANGEPLRLVRRASRRFPVALEVEYGDAAGRTTTEDISRDGAFILGDGLPAVGSRIRLRLKPEGEPPINVRAEIRWHRTSSRPGAGVRFVFDDADSQRQLTELVNKIKRQLAT